MILGEVMRSIATLNAMGGGQKRTAIVKHGKDFFRLIIGKVIDQSSLFVRKPAVMNCHPLIGIGLAPCGVVSIQALFVFLIVNRCFASISLAFSIAILFMVGAHLLFISSRYAMPTGLSRQRLLSRARCSRSFSGLARRAGTS